MARVIIEIHTDDVAREEIKAYAKRTHRTMSGFMIEAAQQHMNRYRFDQVRTIEKRIQDMIKELENLMPDNPGEQTHP